MLKRKRLFVLFLSILSSIVMFFQSTATIVEASDYSFILLSHYRTELAIGDSFYLIAITSTLKNVSFSSSDSKIASVNIYGKVTAKKSGTVNIYAKTKNAEASCKVTIKPTTITLNRTAASMENGSTLTLSASSSSNTPLKWKSSKPSIAIVSESGVVTSKKTGEAVITVSADGTSTSCVITVRKPKVSLSRKKVTLYRKGTYQLSASVSSGLLPKWKSNKTSVVTVDDNGMITAIKHGIAIITATVDGVSSYCEIAVKQPEITLSDTVINLEEGKSYTLKAQVSSGNEPEWMSSNTSIAIVSSNGTVTAKQKGKAYIYASEDGIKSRCTVIVTEQ